MNSIKNPSHTHTHRHPKTAVTVMKTASKRERARQRKREGESTENSKMTKEEKVTFLQMGRLHERMGRERGSESEKDKEEKQGGGQPNTNPECTISPPAARRVSVCACVCVYAGVSKSHLFTGGVAYAGNERESEAKLERRIVMKVNDFFHPHPPSFASRLSEARTGPQHHRASCFQDIV